MPSQDCALRGGGREKSARAEKAEKVEKKEKKEKGAQLTCACSWDFREEEKKKEGGKRRVATLNLFRSFDSRFSESILQPGDGGKDFGSTDKDVRSSLTPDVDRSCGER